LTTGVKIGTMTSNETRAVETPDGRVLDVVTSGTFGDTALVFHVGTPMAATEYPSLTAAAARHGLGVVAFSRPGYGDSTPQPGRSVSAVAADTSAVLDAIGADQFVTLGWSGGGPHALACAALLAPRCRAAVSLAGVAPYGVEGLDFMGGMGASNIEEFSTALAGEEPLTKLLEPGLGDMGTLSADNFVDALGDLVSDVDRASVTPELAELLATSFRNAVSSGVAGWRDDDLAFTRPWGFDVASISVPVAIWQGAEDLMVPYAHGAWLSAHVPGATVHLLPDEGHLSLAGRIDDVVDELVALAHL
jgi:pimeloyl-ACP methyl ester carboxylesterase